MFINILPSKKQQNFTNKFCLIAPYSVCVFGNNILKCIFLTLWTCTEHIDSFFCANVLTIPTVVNRWWLVPLSVILCETHEKWLLREILMLWPRLCRSHNHFLLLLLCLTGTRGLKLRAGEGVCRSRWPSPSACGNSTCMNCFCGWKDPWPFWCHYCTETCLDVNLVFKFIFYLKCPLISVQIMIVTSLSVIYSVCCTLHFQQVTIVGNFMTWKNIL